MLTDIARELSIPCDVEKRSDALPDDRKKPDLRFTLATTKITTLVSDVTVTHPASKTATERSLQQHRQSSSPHRAHHHLSTSMSSAAHSASVGKSVKYRDEDRPEVGVRFIPFALETMGAWSKEANEVLRLLLSSAGSAASAEDFEEKQRERTLDARIRISVALQRGNALVARECVNQLQCDYDVFAQVPSNTRWSRE